MKTMPNESRPPTTEVVASSPKGIVKFGMRRKGHRVDYKVVDVAGRPFCPSAAPHNLVLRHDTIILAEQMALHQRDGWVVASIQRLDSAIDNGTPLGFPSYRIILVRREVDGKPQDPGDETK